jgi:hypothetical protein
MRTKSIIATLFIGGLLSGGTANANIVEDGGFESAPSIGLDTLAPHSFGDGWSETAGYGAILNSGDGQGVPYDGTQFAYLDAGYGLNTLAQTLMTSVGQTYTVSFYVADTYPNLLEVTFGGTVLFDGTAPTNGNSSPSDYVLETFTATATSTSTVLAFSGQYNAGGEGTNLDDVSVTPLASTPVPEPSSLVLFGAAVTGLTTLRHRRRFR